VGHPFDSIDPELEALPRPRRPWRRTTLVILAVTFVLSLLLAGGLRSPAAFATWSGPPRELGNLTNVQLGPASENAWAHGDGAVGDRAVEYRRPLDPDRYRLAPVEGSRRLWVEMRVPDEIEPHRYVPPNSFVGRLVPLTRVGLRHEALETAIESALGRPAPKDAWVLIDGEAPATTRWAIGLAALAIAFATFSGFAIVRLIRPVPYRRDAPDE
jgi:hypothetical protein